MRVLIVGTLDGHFTRANQLARQQGAEVVQQSTLGAALGDLRSGAGFDVVLIDEQYEVSALISALARERILIPVVACGLAQDPEVARKAIHAGALEYLTLPPDPEVIASVLQAVSQRQSRLVHNDPKMRQLLGVISKFAKADAAVMITGQSGTGKEVIARYIHEHSSRANKRFVAVNCAAIPEALLESELFGYEKGAFTGAVARRIGKFEAANGGTLLLDEISEMDVRLQSKLLRAIQEREIDRLGGKAPVKVNVRIIATSNRDLPASVKAGEFREDLFFRLNVVRVDLPSLKERPGDIIPLGEHFIRHYSEVNGVRVRALSEAAKAKLLAQAWPGNVRELENVMHRAVVLASGEEISADAVMIDSVSFASVQDSQPSEPVGSVGNTLADMERQMIINTLKAHHGNRTIAAEVLGISIRTLRNKLKQYTQSGHLPKGATG